MPCKNKKIISSFLAAFFLSASVKAADVAVAPYVGPAIVFNRDFNGEHGKSTLGFSIGFDAFYRLSCQGCRNFSLMMNTGYTSTGPFNFSGVRRKATGHVGTFKETLQIFNWNVGVNWSPKPVGKIKFNLFAAPGIYHTKKKDVSYRDGNNKDLPLPSMSQSETDFGLLVGGGVEVMVSKRSSISFTPRVNINMLKLSERSSIQLPISFKFYF
ncbi:MAG: outer membrane beta-barrel protein [Deltaproteobacteria bacterium]|nr:outer membrane beta-barrel protein [Deltaproteobacteria bacterium]